MLAEMGVPEDEWHDFNAVVDPEGTRPRIFFQKVPEPKAGKNRVHLDLYVGWAEGVAGEERLGRVAAEVDRLVGLGASVFRVVDERGSTGSSSRIPRATSSASSDAANDCLFGCRSRYVCARDPNR